jgi:cytochrome P450
VVADCATLVQEEVDSKGGLSGLAIKAAYAVVKAVKPGFVPEAIDHMLDDFAGRLEPFWADAQAKNEPVGALMNSRASAVADALLSISDERAARAKNAAAKKAYEKLRPTGKKNVEAAVPRLGRLIAKYTSAAATTSAPPPPAP